MDVLFALSCIFIAFLYGTTGVGGILLVPAMQYTLNMNISMAAGTTLASFAIVTIEGTYLHYKGGRLKKDLVLPQCMGAIISGFFGAVTKFVIGDVALTYIFALLIIICGFLALYPPKMFGSLKNDRSRWYYLFAVGIFVGFIAGLTGVGGPVVSIPLMIMAGFPLIPTIAAAQPFSVIACGSGTIGNIVLDQISWNHCLWAVLWQAIGLFIGIKTTPHLNLNFLKTSIALICILTGIFMIAREFF